MHDLHTGVDDPSRRFSSCLIRCSRCRNPVLWFPSSCSVAHACCTWSEEVKYLTGPMVGPEPVSRLLPDDLERRADEAVSTNGWCVDGFGDRYAMPQDPNRLGRLKSSGTNVGRKDEDESSVETHRGDPPCIRRFLHRLGNVSRPSPSVSCVSPPRNIVHVSSQLEALCATMSLESDDLLPSPAARLHQPSSMDSIVYDDLP